MECNGVECNGCVYYLEGLGFEDVVERMRNAVEQMKHPPMQCLSVVDFSITRIWYLKYEKRITTELQTLLSTPPKLWIFSREKEQVSFSFWFLPQNSKFEHSFDTQQTTVSHHDRNQQQQQQQQYKYQYKYNNTCLYQELASIVWWKEITVIPY